MKDDIIGTKNNKKGGEDMKFAIVFTGGTIGSAVSDGFIEPCDRVKYRLLAGYDESEFEIFNPYEILSENLDKDKLTILTGLIVSLKGYDGIIITHGTDSLPYAAAAVSYSLGNDTVPVVFVSSNYILDDERANGRINFKYALDFIRNGYGKGTFISYCNTNDVPKIHRATRVLPAAEYSDSVISLGGEYGRYEDNKFIKNADFYESCDEIEPFGAVNFKNAGIVKLSPYPDIKPVINKGIKSVLLETYHSGTFPEYALRDIDAEIYVTGAEDRVQYKSVLALYRKKVCVLRKATSASMYIKLWMCECTNRCEDMNKSLSGDFIL